MASTNLPQTVLTLANIGKHFSDLVELEQKKLDVREKELDEREEAWNKFSKRFDLSQLSDPIRFDVGGHCFSVSLETLSKVPNTYFSNLVSGRWPPPDGTIFIDRTPIAFGYILEYLRNPEDMPLILPHMSLVLHYLEVDCDFYIVSPLLSYVPLL